MAISYNTELNQFKKNRNIKIIFSIGFIFCIIILAGIASYLKQPTLIIGLMGSIILLGLLPLFLNKPYYLLYLFVGLIPFGTLILIMEHLTVLPIFGALLVLFWLINYLLNKSIIPQVAEYKYLILLPLLLLLSGIIGVNFSISFGLLRTMFQLFIFTFIVIVLLDRMEKLYQLGWVIIISGIMVNSIVLIDQLHILPFRLTGEVIYGRLERITGLLYDPNYFAMQTSVGLGFALIYLVYHKNPIYRIFLFTGIIIFLITLWLTLSLGGIIGLCAMALFLLYWTKQLSINKKIILLLILILFITGFALSPEFQKRIEPELYFIHYGQFWRLGTMRILSWFASANLAIHHPFFGVGIGNSSFFTKYYDPWDVFDYLFDLPVLGAHNIFISFAADNGLFALLIFILLIWYSFNGLGRELKDKKITDSRYNAVLISILAVYFTLLIQNLFLDGWKDKYLWLIIGMSIAGRIHIQSLTKVNAIPPKVF